MVDKNKQKILPKGSNEGFFKKLVSQLKLVIRLMADPRVNFLLKIIPIGSLVYLFVPDLIIGPIDDAAILGFGLYTFVELCPPEVVEEHRAAIQDKSVTSGEKGKVVDAKFKDNKDKQTE